MASVATKSVPIWIFIAVSLLEVRAFCSSREDNDVCVRLMSYIANIHRIGEAGITSRLVYGELETVFAKDRNVFERQRHAWVVVSGQNGREYILDPTQGIQGATRVNFHGPRDAAAETNLATREIDGRALFERAIYRYTPAGYGGIEGPDELTRSDFEDFLPIITGGLR